MKYYSVGKFDKSFGRVYSATATDLDIVQDLIPQHIAIVHRSGVSSNFSFVNPVTNDGKVTSFHYTDDDKVSDFELVLFNE